MAENSGPSFPPACEKCGDALTEPGALLFGPPFQYTEDDEGPPHAFASTKDHLCVGCYYDLLDWLYPKVERPGVLGSLIEHEKANRG
jgi:hypothetical protein